MCGSNRYSSNGNQRLEIMTIEMFVVIGGQLTKDQNRYDKLNNVAGRYWSLEFKVF